MKRTALTVVLSLLWPSLGMAAKDRGPANLKARAKDIAVKAVVYVRGGYADKYFDDFAKDQKFAQEKRGLLVWALEINWSTQTVVDAMELLGAPLSADEIAGLHSDAPRPQVGKPQDTYDQQRASEIASKSARYVRGAFAYEKSDKDHPPVFNDFVKACRFAKENAALMDDALTKAAKDGKGLHPEVVEKAKRLLDLDLALRAAKQRLSELQKDGTSK